MDRWACVDALRLPLQIVLTRHPQWSDQPVAVLDRDDPRGLVLYLNRHARAARLNVGMRCGEATALVSELRTDTVDDTTLEKHTTALAKSLTDFSPRVEPADARPGLFWLDVSGLETLYDRWQTWVESLKETLQQDHGIYVAVVIGFSRFGTFAVVCSTHRSGVFETPQKERRAAGDVSLSNLDIASSTLETMHRLDIRTVDDLLALPAEGLRRRLGDEIFELYQRAQGSLQKPQAAFFADTKASHTDHLEQAETNRERLLFLIKRHLQKLVSTVSESGEKIAGLTLVLMRGDDESLKSTIRPATPTRDTGLLADLVRLRLEKLPIQSGITAVRLTAHGQQTTTEQMQLLAEEPTRDIDAANRAIARLRAEFGSDKILQIVPTKGHLPESRFELCPLETLDVPEIQSDPNHRAIRRFFPTPIQLAGRPRAGFCAGPHTICGGWWVRRIHRDYHLVATEQRLLWAFFDHQRRRWYLHGEF